MITLADALKEPHRRRAAAKAGAKLVDDEVHAKGGVTGLALRAALRALRSVRPDFVESALEALLPHFAPALDPLWVEANIDGKPDAWFRKNAGRVADALLAVTDARAERSSQPTTVRAYRGLRATARPHVEAVVPRLPAFIRAHTQASV